MCQGLSLQPQAMWLCRDYAARSWWEGDRCLLGCVKSFDILPQEIGYMLTSVILAVLKDSDLR